MKKLIESGLWGDRLLAVKGNMVGRYNQCLKDAGLPETHLSSFSIDCMGWSPDIAKDRRDSHYLCHSIANRLVIVLSPEQEFCPIYNPSHSFDWELMKQWFQDHRPQIAEVTKHSGIWLELDQDMDIYHTPEDLLLMNSMTVRPWTPGRLMVGAREQKRLVSELMRPDGKPAQIAKMLTEVPRQLETSVGQFGYIAHKPMVIDPMQFAVPRNFFTPNFGGVFVLRSLRSEDEALLTVEESSSENGVVGPGDYGIIRKLKRFGLVETDLEYWRGHIARLEIIRDSYLMEVLDTTHPNIDYPSLDPVAKKAILHSEVVQKRLDKNFALMDSVIKHILAGRKITPAKDIAMYLAHPASGISDLETEMVWHILSLICDGRSVVQLYRYDKERFFRDFKAWSETRQQWAKAMIGSYYISRTKKEKRGTD